MSYLSRDGQEPPVFRCVVSPSKNWVPKENHLLPAQFIQEKRPIEGAGQVMMEPGLEECKETPILPLSNVTALLGNRSPLFAGVVL